jgi:hypothetical protein
VHGLSQNHAGILGSSDKGPAGLFFGDVVVVGGKVVLAGGTKSAAVEGADGVHRLLFCIESPESWFEDFGTARLAKGRARVTIEARFAQSIRRDEYHVFVTPEGDSNGLYVAQKGRNAFEVREQRGGRSSIEFSYRIVARRADVPRSRLPRFELPAAARVEKPAKPGVRTTSRAKRRSDPGAEILESLRGKRTATARARSKR